MTENWISVNDRKPNMNQLVLAYHNFKDKFCDDQHIIITRFEYQDYWTDGTITHWMPLPKPPTN